MIDLNSPLLAGSLDVDKKQILLSSSFILLCILLYKLLEKKESETAAMLSPESTLSLIKARRSVTPKDLSGEPLSKEQVEFVLEAANWAPSHNGTEPWRFTVLEGPDAITDYLDMIDNWYNDNKEEIPDDEFAKFLSKMNGARASWPQNVSHAIVIGMARQSLHDRRMAEWEEIAAVGMSVQNLHLALTSIEGASGFWSSHTFCKRARDSKSMQEFLGLKKEDRVLGAFLMGKIVPGKNMNGHRRNVWEKVKWIS